MTTPVKFDAIFSLGHNCQVAAQLRRNKRVMARWTGLTSLRLMNFVKSLKGNSAISCFGITSTYTANP